MHAWLLLLAVLATFQTFVQVASTEDISSRFIAAISPQKVSSSDTTTASVTNFNINNKTKVSFHKKKSARKTLALENSVSDSNNNNNIIDIKDFMEYNNDKLVYDTVAQQQQTTLRTEKLDIFFNKNLVNTETDQNNNKNNNNNNNNQNKINFNNTTHNLVKETNENYEMAVKENTSLATVAQTATAITTTADQKHKHKHHQHQHHHQYPHHHHHQKHQQQHSSHHSSSSRNTAQIAVPNFQPELEINDMSASSSNSFTDSSNNGDDSDNDAVSVAVVEQKSNANAVIDEDEPATYSNKEIFSEKAKKPDPAILVEIENSLLSLFNMKRPPKIDRSKIIIPEAMKKLYAQIMGHGIDSVNIPRPGMLTKSANTVRSFIHQDSKIDDRFPHHHRFRLYFDIKSIPADEKLKAAELQLTRDEIINAALKPHNANRTRYQVLVYDITRVGIRGKREPNYLLLDNKTVRLNSTETVSLDVQPAVHRWLASPKKNHGLLVEVRTMRLLKPAPHHHVRLRRSAGEPLESWQHKQPLLLTYTDDERHKSRSIRDVNTRSKRAQHHRRSHRRKNADEICRRHSLYVDFTDVGWSDWIVAPQGYDAYYCHGKCPFPLAEHLNSTNHAVVQTLVNNMNPGKVPKPCCVPTQLEGISMLYLNDQSTVVVKNYQDMAVVGCGCR